MCMPAECQLLTPISAGRYRRCRSRATGTLQDSWLSAEAGCCSGWLGAAALARVQKLPPGSGAEAAAWRAGYLARHVAARPHDGLPIQRRGSCRETGKVNRTLLRLLLCVVAVGEAGASRLLGRPETGRSPSSICSTRCELNAASHQMIKTVSGSPIADRHPHMCRSGSWCA